MSRASATNSVAPPSPVTPVSSADRPVTGASSARTPFPPGQPVTRTGVPGAAPATRWARTSTAPRTATRLVTVIPARTVCREAIHPSPVPSGSICVRPGSPPTITLLSYDGTGAVAVE